MTDLRLDDRLAIQALNDEFGHRLDHGDLDGFVDLFTEDVRYANGARQLNGQKEMRAFFAARAAGDRVSRHLYSGLRIAFEGVDRASGTSVWLTFAGSGPLPIRPADPFAVADVSDRYFRTPDRGWRIAVRQIAPVMLSDTVPELPSRSSS
ncbi:nuclear transport factor 2 family protein [Amorphus sp. 3PC139-8]|uniref:nuclear transport factor 2 family protein n=1 Tax=Amorphus sp. 3PC139-8 TaxID=2735676 RepID=UPI00345DC3EE